MAATSHDASADAVSTGCDRADDSMGVTDMDDKVLQVPDEPVTSQVTEVTVDEGSPSVEPTGDCSSFSEMYSDSTIPPVHADDGVEQTVVYPTPDTSANGRHS